MTSKNSYEGYWRFYATKSVATNPGLLRNVKLLVASSFVACVCASSALADVIVNDAGQSVSYTILGGMSDSDTDSDFGMAVLGPLPVSVSASMAEGVVDNTAGTVTFSGSGNAQSDDDFDADLKSFVHLAVDCDFGYEFTATVLNTDDYPESGGYRVVAGIINWVSVFPGSGQPAPTPISLSGSLLASRSLLFEFAADLDDQSGDGFDVEFEYDLVLTAVDRETCDFFDSVHVPTVLACDFNGDDSCDPVDMDLLSANLGGADLTYDLDASTAVDDADIRAWLDSASDPANLYLEGAENFVIGDVNLDGTVNSTDLGLLLNSFDDENGPLYSAGNLNDDTSVNITDLGLLLNNFESASAAAVPEPGTFPMLLISVIGLIRFARRKSRRRSRIIAPSCRKSR